MNLKGGLMRNLKNIESMTPFRKKSKMGNLINLPLSSFLMMMSSVGNQYEKNHPNDVQSMDSEWRIETCPEKQNLALGSNIWVVLSSKHDLIWLM